jgi:stage IV sporulation protein FB
MLRPRGNPAAFAAAGQGDDEPSLCDRPATLAYRSRSLPWVNARTTAPVTGGAKEEGRLPEMFGPVSTTPYDVRFRLFGIPVTVTPWFWLAGLIFGWSPDVGEHPSLLVITIGCLFISILVHEMGHALTALTFGWPPEVYLYGFGGLAVYRPTYGRTTARQVLISFAGPGAGFLLYGLIYVAAEWFVKTDAFLDLSPNSRSRVLVFFIVMEQINLYWGLVNLLPVLPLDGGRIAESLLIRFRPWDGPRLTVTLSIVVAGVAAFYFLLHREEYGMFPGLLFGLLAFSNLQTQQSRGLW